jgi:hypothetical protein
VLWLGKYTAKFDTKYRILSTNIQFGSEQYLDLISAADAIITMSKNAQAIQTNFGRLQAACDVESIKMNAKLTLQKRDEENNQSKHITKISYTEERRLILFPIARIDTKRRYVYIIAALVKSLADVPEQVSIYINQGGNKKLIFVFFCVIDLACA